MYNTCIFCLSFAAICNVITCLSEIYFAKDTTQKGMRYLIHLLANQKEVFTTYILTTQSERFSYPLNDGMHVKQKDFDARLGWSLGKAVNS